MSRVDVVKLLARLGIDARRDGDELLSLCPSHSDSKPSWSIHARTGKHHCFSCGFGGTATSLVIHALDAKRLGWTDRDAWLWLTEQGLLEGDGEQGFAVELFLVPPRERATMTMPRAVAISPLSDWPSAARAYMHKREITAEQVVRWGLGYAVDGRLGGRIVFPVRDRHGRLLSYSARAFDGAAVRYLTPDASEHPDKAALFGEALWPAPRERSRVVVVEGAIKALAVERACGCCVAGVLGATQARNASVAGKLASFSEVVVLLDNDAAGDTGADSLMAALARHTHARRARMVGPAVDDAAALSVRQAVG